MGDARVSVALVWDWFWIALPVWCSDREYVLHEDVDTLADDTIFWKLKDQSKESVAKITGLSESDLTFPWYAYIPPGWVALAAIVLIVNFVSGPSPKKRFAKLASDDDYIQSLMMMLHPDESYTDEDAGEQDIDQLEAAAQLRFDNAVAYLVSQGISESTAQRTLQFLVGYLHSHPDTTIP